MSAIRQRCIDLASEFFGEFVAEELWVSRVESKTFKEEFTAWLKEEEGK